MTPLAEIRLFEYRWRWLRQHQATEKTRGGYGKPCQEKTFGSKKWEHCYATGGGSVGSEIWRKCPAHVPNLAAHTQWSTCRLKPGPFLSGPLLSYWQMCFIVSKWRQQFSNDNADTCQNICITHGQSSHLGDAWKLSYLLREVKTRGTELCFSSVTEPWWGTDFQQTGDTSFVAFTNYLHFKTHARKNLSDNSLVSEVPGNHTTKQ